MKDTFTVMSSQEKSTPPPERDSLSVEVGSWFKAHATGRGVLVIPLLIVLLAAVELARLVVR
jgi:hypothetical protein